MTQAGMAEKLQGDEPFELAEYPGYLFETANHVKAVSLQVAHRIGELTANKANMVIVALGDNGAVPARIIAGALGIEVPEEPYDPDIWDAKNPNRRYTKIGVNRYDPEDIEGVELTNIPDNAFLDGKPIGPNGKKQEREIWVVDDVHRTGATATLVSFLLSDGNRRSPRFAVLADARDDDDTRFHSLVDPDVWGYPTDKRIIYPNKVNLPGLGPREASGLIAVRHTIEVPEPAVSVDLEDGVLVLG